MFLTAYHAAKIERPNSMHYAGATFSHANGCFDAVLPIARRVCADVGVAFDVDSATLYGFTAEYGPGRNNKLDKHVDNSIVTINWCFDRYGALLTLLSSWMGEARPTQGTCVCLRNDSTFMQCCFPGSDPRT